MAKGKQGPEDFAQTAFRTFQQAIGEEPVEGALGDEPPKEKDPNAVALGRKGGLKGGRARADSLTPEQKSEIGRKAVEARWAKKRGETQPEQP